MVLLSVLSMIPVIHLPYYAGMLESSKTPEQALVHLPGCLHWLNPKHEERSKRGDPLDQSFRPIDQLDACGDFAKTDLESKEDLGEGRKTDHEAANDH